MAACGNLPMIKAQLRRVRGRWVGHVLRMPEDRLARQLFFGSLDTHAPPQSHPPLSLMACYRSDIASRITRAELRKLDRPCLLLAAADKPAWNARF